jgi:hypothetical protein
MASLYLDEFAFCQPLTTVAKPLVAGHFQRRFFWAGKQGWAGSAVRARVGSERFRGGFEELKNPNPVSGADPQFFVVCSTPMAVR